MADENDFFGGVRLFPRNRYSIALLVGLFCTAAFVAGANWYDQKPGFGYKDLVGASAAVVGISAALLGYLMGPRLKLTTPLGELSFGMGEVGDSMRRVMGTISDRLEALEQAPTGQPLVPDEVAQILLPQVQEKLGDVFVARYEKAQHDLMRNQSIDLQFSGTMQRLYSELGAQTRRGNLNLVIGVLTTGVAIAILAILAFSAPPAELTWLSLALHFVPKIAISIFVQVFAFFFLKLYKNGLLEIRSYHDEITKVSLQWVAVQVAISSEEPTSKAALSKDLFSATAAMTDSKVDAAEADVKTDKLVQAIVDAAVKEIASAAKKGAEDKE